MKKNRAFRAFFRRQFGSNSKRLVWMLTTFALVSGCSKKATSSPPPAAPPVSETPNQPAAVTQATTPTTGAQPAVDTNGQPDLRALDRTLIRWMVRNKRRPADFQEFASSAGTPIPPPPPGKKYVFSSTMHIELVNQ